MLVFPAEAPGTQGVIGFIDGYLDERAALPRRLGVDVGDQNVTVDTFDEAVAERAERHAEGANRVGARYTLLKDRDGGAVIDERAARRINEVARCVVVAGAKFTDLTGRAGVGTLMTLDASLRVVDRAEAIGKLFTFLENRFVSIELGRRAKGILQVVGPRIHVGGRRFRRRLAFSRTGEYQWRNDCCDKQQ